MGYGVWGIAHGVVLDGCGILYWPCHFGLGVGWDGVVDGGV